jgi:3-deoxy-manno-octulosonate cytidylyltransferase (CMP-KDO synthetase)
MSYKILVCIPARFHSSRLPGKPLLEINNKTIIHHVYDNVCKIKYEKEIVILTDDKRIKTEVDTFAEGICHIIEEECINGTDRIIHFLNQNIEYNDYNMIVNVQGDEPFIDIENIHYAINNYVIKNQEDKNVVCSTIYYNTFNNMEIMSKSRVKLVLDKKNNIMYGSRTVIPSNKNYNINENICYNIHIGLFVFNRDYLVNKFSLEDTPNQLSEDIEWLKIIEQGYKINAIYVNEHEIGIDTSQDYIYLKDKYER